MPSTIVSTIVRSASALAIGVLLGAAGPDEMQMQMPVQLADVGPLAQPAPAAPKTLTFQNTMYQAAPVPDEDAAPPVAAVRTEAQLAPKMLSPRSLFQGDGYSNGSSQEAALDRRKAAAAGLGLSVPVN
jgi:hypothetical protein